MEACSVCRCRPESAEISVSAQTVLSYSCKAVRAFLLEHSIVEEGVQVDIVCQTCFKRVKELDKLWNNVGMTQKALELRRKFCNYYFDCTCGKPEAHTSCSICHQLKKTDLCWIAGDEVLPFTDGTAVDFLAKEGIQGEHPGGLCVTCWKFVQDADLWAFEFTKAVGLLAGQKDVKNAAEVASESAQEIGPSNDLMEEEQVENLELSDGDSSLAKKPLSMYKGRKSYACPACSFMATHPSSLRSHAKVTHGLRLRELQTKIRNEIGGGL